MTHRALVIAVAKDLGLPFGIPKIISEYAELSDIERLKLMLGANGMVTVTKWYDEHFQNRYELYVQDTCNGIEISSTLTGESRECVDRVCFMNAMNARYIELNIKDDLDSWSLGYTLFGHLQDELVYLWWSF